MADHDHPVIQAIARRAFHLYESAGSHHGRDHDDWFQAERELMSQLNVEADGLALVVQIPIEEDNQTHIVATVSPWSILLLMVPTESIVDGCVEPDLHDLIRYISLPREVIPDQVTASVNEQGFSLRLPFMVDCSALTDAVTSSATPPEGGSHIIRTLSKELGQSLPDESARWPTVG